MRNFLKLSLHIGLTLSGISAFAQSTTLFAPFDCRKHAESVEEIPLEIEAPAASALPIDSSLLVVKVPELRIAIDTVDEWENWSYVENFRFGKDRGAMPMITDLNALHPFFRDKVKELISRCHAQGIELAVVESYRTHAKQSEYKVMGRKYTSSKAGRSKHQYGLAVDVVPIVDSVAVWHNPALWRKIGITGEKLGLHWGGRWRRPYDPGHFEWTAGLTSAQLTAGYLPPVRKQTELYPCLKEDLVLLRKYWKEWETSQSSLSRK